MRFDNPWNHAGLRVRMVHPVNARRLSDVRFANALSEIVMEVIS